ncbi:MAG: GIY-YIG nuclease family protein [Methylococcales bacterium]|nr:GIY-YIG nuclease family protein [Methylococcales bacterium]
MTTKTTSAWFVYLLECLNGKIYTGITPDVEARFNKHLAGKGAKFTKMNPPTRLLASICCDNRSEASKLEYHVKQLSPDNKRALGVVWNEIHQGTTKMRLKEKQVEVGYLYLTTAKQYRAVLAMKGEFMIYAPSLEGAAALDLNAPKLPFENQPFKKCQILTFAKKDYQAFGFNGSEAIKHPLSAQQLADVIAQCNAKSAIAALLAE